MGIFDASKKDLKSIVFWRDCFSEFLTTTILTTVILLVLITNNKDIYKPTATHLGFFVSVYVYMVLEAYGPFASVMNPMGSFCLFLAGKFSLVKALIFIVLELLGTAAGTGIGYYFTPSIRMEKPEEYFQAFNPHLHGLNNMQAISIEAFFSFNLIFVLLSCAGGDLKRPHFFLPHLAIAFALALGILAGATHTGGLMNPIVPLGPAFLSNSFDALWIYWLGPFIGGPLAVGLYKIFIWVNQKDAANRLLEINLSEQNKSILKT